MHQGKRTEAALLDDRLLDLKPPSCICFSSFFFSAQLYFSFGEYEAT